MIKGECYQIIFQTSHILAMARGAFSAAFGPNILDLFNSVRPKDYTWFVFCLVTELFSYAFFVGRLDTMFSQEINKVVNIHTAAASLVHQ